MEALQGEIACF